MVTYRELKGRAAALNLLIQEARDVEFDAVLEDDRMRVREFGLRPFGVFGSPQDRRRRQSSKRARYRNPETGVECSGFGRKLFWIKGKK
jgi:DNA-binding protein H-NS